MHKRIMYDVSVTRTLTLSTTLTLVAATEDAARTQATSHIYSASALTWDIADDLDWQEDEDSVTVDLIEEA